MRAIKDCKEGLHVLQAMIEPYANFRLAIAGCIGRALRDAEPGCRAVTIMPGVGKATI